MYHPFIEAFAMTLADLPITFVTLTIYSIVLYFVVGLQASAGQFLCIISIHRLSASTNRSYSVFYLFIITTSLVMKAYFRTVASIFSDPAPAQAIAGVTLLVFAIYTGYQIPVPQMIGALRWLIYINVRSPSSQRVGLIHKLWIARQIRVRIDPDERISYIARSLFISCSLWRWV